MQREIIFRGKEYGTDKWAYGDLVKFAGDQYEIVTRKVRDIPYVKYETVGQYIGLTDKNGKKIFEDDILRRNGRDIFIVEWNNLLARFEMKLVESGAYYNPTIIKGECEVIGNIYDNPELMKSKNDEQYTSG